jgi:hypothetical protein
LTSAVALVAVALAGCGGGGDERDSATASAPTTSSTASSATAPTPDAGAPEAVAPVTELVGEVERFSMEGDCAKAVSLIMPAVLPDPEGGPSAENCQAIQGSINILRRFVPGDSAVFGTGAVIDGTDGGERIALTATLDETKHFKLTGITERGAQVGTDAPSGVDFEGPAAAFVAALRGDDCKSAHAALSSISRLAYANPKQFCSVFEDNFMADPSALGSRLQADPTAELVDFGGTRNAHFFGLSTNPSGYRTIFVGTTAGGVPLVTDVLPVER